VSSFERWLTTGSGQSWLRYGCGELADPQDFETRRSCRPPGRFPRLVENSSDAPERRRAWPRAGSFPTRYGRGRHDEKGEWSRDREGAPRKEGGKERKANFDGAVRGPAFGQSTRPGPFAEQLCSPTALPAWPSSPALEVAGWRRRHVPGGDQETLRKPGAARTRLQRCGPVQPVCTTLRGEEILF